MLQRLTIALMLAALAACTRPLPPIRYDFTKTTGANALQKAPTCTFDLLSSPPARSFEEIGVLEPHRYELATKRSASTAAEFRDAVAPEVCAAGGDAVITEINGFGFYARGTVIRFKD